MTAPDATRRFVIRPNDSSGAAQFAVAVLLVVVPGLACAALFASHGAWAACVPVAVVSLASVWALAIDTRLRRERVEYIEIRAATVAVHDSERERPGEWFELPRAWLRVDETDAPYGGVRLALAVGGRRRPICRNLNDGERREIAAALRRAFAEPADRSEFQPRSIKP